MLMKVLQELKVTLGKVIVDMVLLTILYVKMVQDILNLKEHVNL